MKNQFKNIISHDNAINATIGILKSRYEGGQ